MRILAVSDIHGQIDTVRRLRELETDRFDAIIVAGDIGQDLSTALGVFQILESFRCPILYIYGNWDHSLAYNEMFATDAHHLHNGCATIEGIVFAGFSGVDENWGQNALAASIEADLKARYAAGSAEIDGRIEALERSERALLIECEAAPAQANKAHMRPVWVVRQKLTVLRDKRKQLDPELMAEYREGYKAVLIANRRELVERMSSYPMERTVVVTHDRLTRTAVDMPSVPLFLFGHRHGFTDTCRGGSRYVNVSALDHRIAVIPEDVTGRDYKRIRSADIGSYTVIEIDRQMAIQVTPHPLRVMPSGWKQVPVWPGMYAPLDQSGDQPIAR